MAKSQCSLAVVSCSICLSTSATDKLQLLFFLPQTTFSRPVSTLCSSEFKSLQLSKRKQNKTKQIPQQLVTLKKQTLTQEVPAAEQLGLILFKECPCNLPLFPHQLIVLNTITIPSAEMTSYIHLTNNTPTTYLKVHSVFKNLCFLKDNILRHHTFTYYAISFFLFFLALS